MKHLLMAKGLQGLVDEALAAVEALFHLRLQKAFSTIVLLIESAQLYLVTSCKEP